MKKEVVSLFCVLALVGSTPLAFAGAYGEKEQPEELPAPPPPAHVAAVEQEVNYGAPGPYVQVGGTYGFENFGYLGPSRNNTYENGAGGYQLRAGYRINEMFAAELEWEQYFNFEGDRSAPDVDEMVLTANGKFYPCATRVQPYLLGGFGWVNGQTESQNGTNDFDKDALGLRFGVGVEFYITQQLGIAAEGGYIFPITNGLANADFDTIPVSGSIFYRFN